MFCKSQNAMQTGILGIGVDYFGRLYFRGVPTGQKRYPLKPVIDSVRIVEDRSEIEDFSIEGAAISAAIDDDIDSNWGGIAFAKEDFDVDLELRLLGDGENVIVKITTTEKKLLKALYPFII
jgi:hypothetical protein